MKDCEKCDENIRDSLKHLFYDFEFFKSSVEAETGDELCV